MYTDGNKKVEYSDVWCIHLRILLSIIVNYNRDSKVDCWGWASFWKTINITFCIDNWHCHHIRGVGVITLAFPVLYRPYWFIIFCKALHMYLHAKCQTRMISRFQFLHHIHIPYTTHRDQSRRNDNDDNNHESSPEVVRSSFIIILLLLRYVYFYFLCQ
jgi:hypothetical protein